jgi:thiosulfate reductase cytochrome b subunit
MRLVLQIISWISLAGTILPPVLFLAGRIELDQSKTWILIATVVWFVATSLWMGRPKIEDELVI